MVPHHTPGRRAGAEQPALEPVVGRNSTKAVPAAEGELEDGSLPAA